MTIRSCISRHSLSLALGMALLLVGTACDQVPVEPPSVEPKPDPEEVITQEVPKNKATKSDEVFWTEERMEAAEPYDPGFGSKAGKSSSATGDSARPNPDREPVRQSGHLPEHANDDVEDIEGLNPSSKGGRLPSKVPFYKSYPYKTIGKAFFVADGKPSWCSAAVIKADNRSLVWTAGHCVSEYGQQDWHENWVFVPAYKEGSAPFGMWSARVKATLRGWHVDDNRHYDIGAVKVEKINGKPIADRVGSLGYQFNADRNQDWDIFGYPGKQEQDSGLYMWECSARFKRKGGNASQVGPQTNQIDDCGMTPGASGGPWVIDCPNCKINSVSSWFLGDNTIPDYIDGPYHGDGAQKLHDVAGGL